LPKRVLIADDSDAIRRVVRWMVDQQPDLEVCGTTENGIQTVETALALRPDVLVLDLKMPGLSGMEVAGILKQSLPDTKTVLFTLYADSISKSTASVLGTDVVPKIAGLDALLRKVRTLLRPQANVIDATLSYVRSHKIDVKRLEILTETLGTPLSHCGRDLKYRWANWHYANWLQKPLDKIIGCSILDVLGKSAFDILSRYFDQALTGEDVAYEAEAEFDIIGRRRVTAVYKATADVNGQADGWLSCVDDVTDTEASTKNQDRS
jgi:CheY-like chemotaxis protein